MAEIEITKKIEINKKMGEDILGDFFSYDIFVDMNEEVYFDELNIKNSLIFLDELKDQLIDAMNDIIEKYEQAEKHYGNGDVRLDFNKVMSSSYN